MTSLSEDVNFKTIVDTIVKTTFCTINNRKKYLRIDLSFDLNQHMSE